MTTQPPNRGDQPSDHGSERPPYGQSSQQPFNAQQTPYAQNQGQSGPSAPANCNAQGNPNFQVRPDSQGRPNAQSTPHAGGPQQGAPQYGTGSATPGNPYQGQHQNPFQNAQHNPAGGFSVAGQGGSQQGYAGPYPQQGGAQQSYAAGYPQQGGPQQPGTQQGYANPQQGFAQASPQGQDTLQGVAHLIGIAGVIGAAIFYFVTRDRGPKTRAEGLKSFNWQILLTVVCIPINIISNIFALMASPYGFDLFDLFAILLSLLWFAIVTTNIVFCVLNWSRANKGEETRYPIQVDWVK